MLSTAESVRQCLAAWLFMCCLKSAELTNLLEKFMTLVGREVGGCMCACVDKWILDGMPFFDWSSQGSIWVIEKLVYLFEI